MARRRHKVDDFLVGLSGKARLPATPGARRERPRRGRDVTPVGPRVRAAAVRPSGAGLWERTKLGGLPACGPRSGPGGAQRVASGCQRAAAERWGGGREHGGDPPEHTPPRPGGERGGEPDCNNGVGGVQPGTITAVLLAERTAGAQSEATARRNRTRGLSAVGKLPRRVQRRGVVVLGPVAVPGQARRPRAMGGRVTATVASWTPPGPSKRGRAERSAAVGGPFCVRQARPAARMGGATNRRSGGRGSGRGEHAPPAATRVASVFRALRGLILRAAMRSELERRGR